MSTAPVSDPPGREVTGGARVASEGDVLAAVVELSSRYHAPSTTLITWHLAAEDWVSASFQAAVHDALQRLQAAGRVACVAHRGTWHWSAVTERG